MGETGVTSFGGDCTVLLRKKERFFCCFAEENGLNRREGKIYGGEKGSYRGEKRERRKIRTERSERALEKTT